MAVKLDNLAPVKPTSTNFLAKDLAATTIPKKVHNLNQTRELHDAGFQPVISSWVSAIGIQDNDLYIRFHNGNVYKYKGFASRYDSIMRAQSKGRAIHKFIFGKAIGTKVGTLPITGDVEVVEDLNTQEVQELHNEQLFKANVSAITGDSAFNIENLHTQRELLPAPVESLKPVPVETIQIATITPIQIFDIIPTVVTTMLAAELLFPIIPTFLNFTKVSQNEQG